MDIIAEPQHMLAAACDELAAIFSQSVLVKLAIKSARGASGNLKAILKTMTKSFSRLSTLTPREARRALESLGVPYLFRVSREVI
jgi:hypothetical protein